MKPQRPPRPAPRTLASLPTAAPLRGPQATAHEPRFPTLAVVLASGVVLPACHDPVCGSSRAEELERHGPVGLRAAGNGRATDALHELGVALGVVAHGRTTVPDTQVEGRRAVVHPLPPQPPPQVQPPPTVPDDNQVTGGVAIPVTPQPLVPPQPQPPPHVQTQPTTPHPPAVRGARRPVAPAPPRPPRALQGDIIGVSPLPADLTRRPA